MPKGSKFMDPWLEKFQSLSDLPLSADFHNTVMRRIYFLRLRKYFAVAIILLGSSLIISGLAFWRRLIDNGVDTLLGMAFNDFELSASYLTSYGRLILSAMPVHALAIFMINLAVAGYAAFLGNKVTRALHDNSGFETFGAADRIINMKSRN